MTPMPELFVHPQHAWQSIADERREPPLRRFLPTLLLLPLLPALCLFIGTTQVGWSLPGDEQPRFLTLFSGAYLGLMCYLAFVAGIGVLAALVEIVLYRTSNHPGFQRSLRFATCVSLPLMLAGVVALWPARWLMIGAAGVACAYSARLLFTGLPIYMHLKPRNARFYASCILGFGFLALLTTAFIFIEVWADSLAGAGEYLK
ncbi:MAG: Inner membrane protein YohC [Pseudomonas citronellolis]|nr:MAG: Inner membrane protein YohC [Pseudomonas citronellolis]